MELVLLDTDIGGDIDDALCLAYLLAQPRCELCGITTVGGEPERRAAIASALCKAAYKNVPIRPGAADPLVVDQRQRHAHQAEHLGSWPHDREFPRADAVAFMRQVILSRPAEVTLLGIGPMTNIARLFIEDPQIPKLLKRLVLMAGWFRDRPPRADVGDWNVLCDPHAAEIVYRSEVSVHRSVPLDVTMDARLEAREFCRRSTGALEIVRDLVERESLEEMWFHDPLAAATVFDDHVCTFRQGLVSVDMDDSDTMGMTRWQPDATRHEVAFEANLDRFFAHFFSVFTSDQVGNGREPCR